MLTVPQPRYQTGALELKTCTVLCRKNVAETIAMLQRLESCDAFGKICSSEGVTVIQGEVLALSSIIIITTITSSWYVCRIPPLPPSLLPLSYLMRAAATSFVTRFATKDNLRCPPALDGAADPF